MRRRAAVAWTSILLIALAGCTTTDRGGRATAQQSTERQEPDPRSPAWWAVLNDPILVSLLERAHRDNLDPREAKVRVRAARIRREALGSDRFPTISAVHAAATRAQEGEETDPDHANELHAVAYDASWEVDVLGGPHGEPGPTDAGPQENAEDARDVFVTFFAEVALNYIEVRSFQTRLSLANEHIVSQSETYIVTRWRRQAETAGKRDLEQARLNLEETRAQIPALEAGLAEARHRMALLLNRSPEELVPELSAAGTVPSARIGLAVGVPADTLRQRPDVRRAEHKLAAQLAQATTMHHPGFALSGSIGLDAMPPVVISSLIEHNVNWAPFDADSIRQNIKVQTQLQDQSLTDFEVAVITALKEVDDVLVAYTKGEMRRESLERAVESARSTAELANTRYLSDQASFAAVLRAQRSLLSLQDQLATSEGEVASNLIRLYKALGGGWAALAAAPGDGRNAIRTAVDNQPSDVTEARTLSR